MAVLYIESLFLRLGWKQYFVHVAASLFFWWWHLVNSCCTLCLVRWGVATILTTV